MTREQAVSRWHTITWTVFCAEDAIVEEWKDRLRSAARLSPEERTALAEEYCHAVAVEIVGRTSDEELAGME